MSWTSSKNRILSSKLTTHLAICRTKLIRWQKMKRKFRIPPSILITEKLNIVSTRKMQRKGKTKIQPPKLRCQVAMVTAGKLKRIRHFSPTQISQSDIYYPWPKKSNTRGSCRVHTRSGRFSINPGRTLLSTWPRILNWNHQCSLMKSRFKKTSGRQQLI